MYPCFLVFYGVFVFSLVLNERLRRCMLECNSYCGISRKLGTSRGVTWVHDMSRKDTFC